jgi:phosphate transport system protein
VNVSGDLGPPGLPPVETGAGAELRVQYHAWLDDVDDELVGGALVVADAMPRTLRALLAGDTTCVVEARAAVANVRERCRHVEEQGFLLLAREAPVAGDLRRLVSLLRLVYDVERSGSLMRHVAEATERLDARRLPAELREHLHELGVRSIEVLAGGIDAWRRRDALAVHELDEADAAVDTLRTTLLVRARELEGASAQLLVLGLLGRYFERLADHGVAFAQHVTFVVTGERVEVGR